MDVLVNFSDLVNKDRKDLSSWKAACSALNNMMRIYPECFSSVGDSFAPLRVHANIGSIDGVDQKKLETFLGKFLLVLDNEVKIEKVDFSGEKRFIEAGQNAAYCVDINGGLWNAKESKTKHNPELVQLYSYCSDMKDSFSREERRMLYHGMTLPVLPAYNLSVETLAKNLAIEFLAGGDRFSRFDISCALEGLKLTTDDALAKLESSIRKELVLADKAGYITQEFTEKQLDVWVRKNDLRENHLGRIFDQYSGKKKVNSERRSPKEVYREMTSKKAESKDKGMKI